jgi:putative transposase
VSIALHCRVLGVSRSGYYDWLARHRAGPRGRAAEDAALLAVIEEIHGQFGYYGSPRVRAELLARDHHVGRHRVAKLMRLHGIRACRGKTKSRPRSAPPARRPEIVDHIQQDFHADTENAVWFTDITPIRTTEGWLWAAAVLDAFNREVISWAVDSYETPKTALRALREAIAIRRPPAGCIIHSDRGYQFTSNDWLNLAAGNGLEVSMGETKTPHDNAAMESWFASFKNEALYPYGQPKTRREARQILFGYIWQYNTQRRHSSLGHVAPRVYATESSTCP